MHPFLNALQQIALNNEVPAPVQQQRQKICNTCPHRNTLVNGCTQCGCLLSLKTKIKSEYCPLGKWYMYL